MLAHCLRRGPDDRPDGAAEVYLRLHELGKASGVLIVSPETLQQLTTRFREATENEATAVYVPRDRLAWRWAATGAVVAAVAAVAYLLLR